MINDRYLGSIGEKLYLQTLEWYLQDIVYYTIFEYESLSKIRKEAGVNFIKQSFHKWFVLLYLSKNSIEKPSSFSTKTEVIEEKHENIRLWTLYLILNYPNQSSL